ncbi:hypothetical protein AB0C34_29195, partial [Nocardia sp. NPDC049220]
RPSWLAIIIVLTGVAILSIGELWQSAGGFEVSNSLAPPHAIGEYLGVFGTGLRLAETIGPVLLTGLCLGLGRPGWYITGALLLTAGTLTPATIRWAEKTRPKTNTPIPEQTR